MNEKIVNQAEEFFKKQGREPLVRVFRYMFDYLSTHENLAEQEKIRYIEKMIDQLIPIVVEENEE